MNLITSLPSEHVQKFSFPNSSEWHMRVLIQTVCLFTTASLSSTMNPMLQWLWTLPSTMMQRFQIFVFKSCCSVAKLFPTLCDPMDCSMSGFLVLHLLPFLLLSSIFPSIKVFCNELTLCIRWPKYLSFSIRLPWQIRPPAHPPITTCSPPHKSPSPRTANVPLDKLLAPVQLAVVSLTLFSEGWKVKPNSRLRLKHSLPGMWQQGVRKPAQMKGTGTCFSVCLHVLCWNPGLAAPKCSAIA